MEAPKTPKDYILLPNGTALIANDNQGRQILSVGFKETYTIGPDGRCLLSNEQEPFNFDDALAEDDEIQLLPRYSPYKLVTDVVVKGCACAPGGQAIDRMVAVVMVGRYRKEVLVLGNRKCTYRKNQPPLFSEPEPFLKIPLTYHNSYGGMDETVPLPKPTVFADLLNPHPGIYPRNDLGKGYVVYDNPERIEGLELPNLEDPQDCLIPERLVSGSPNNWWKQPLPQSFGWFSAGWYPRIVHLGCLPDGLPEDERRIPEVKRGYLPIDHQKALKDDRPLVEKMDFQMTSAASPGLSFPYLRGDEQVALEGMQPDGRWTISLPGKAVDIDLQFRGETHKLPVVLQTVLIDSDAKQMTMEWRGCWYPPVMLPLRFPTLKNPDWDELEGIDIRINGLALH